MRVKLDEHLPRAARDRLLTLAWDVHDVYDEGLVSSVDAQIQEACEREVRILITLDMIPRIASSVVFPAPDGSMIVTDSPRAMSSVIHRSR